MCVEGRTKPLFRRVARLDDLNDTRAEGLNRGRVVGEDTHVTCRCSKIHLDDFGGGENSLENAFEVKVVRGRNCCWHEPGEAERGTS